MTMPQFASCLALVTLMAPAAVALKWLVVPPHGRTRRGPGLVLATVLFGSAGQVCTLAGVTEAASLVRLVGTVLFALMCVELLDRQPRQGPR